MRWLVLFCLFTHTAFGATYYINPVKGDDHNSGKSKNRAWKSFAPANQLKFKAGDHLLISPGQFDTSLQLIANGTAARPVIVSFAPGRYDFYDTHAYRAKLAISNTNDVPDGLKAIALYISNSKFVKLNGRGASLVMHAKMIETSIDHSENITIDGLSYNYQTPTVSEFRVTALDLHSAKLKVNSDSHYSVKDSALYWEGEGWQYKSSWYWQEFNPVDAFVSRSGLSFNKSTFNAEGDNQLTVHFAQNPGLKLGYVYQTRDVTRDCAGIFLQRSKNLVLKNVCIYFMHGMGVVSQFCENIKIDSLVVKPAAGRTCAAWADILHFAGCKGLIDVRNSYLSAANDDAMNVHGLHLRIMDQPAANQLRLRFMHNQTYGFMPYLPGDSIELIHGNSLLSFAANVIKSAQMLNDREILVTLKKPVTATLVKDDAVENITWTPRVHVQHTIITSIPTRGILVTTRKPALIEHNRFIRTAGAGILVADDAESWYESGPVKNLKIVDNEFIDCGEPVIEIHPENTRFDGPVHQNILIARNRFTLKSPVLFSAKSTSGIRIEHNQIRLAPGADTTRLFRFDHAEKITRKDNRIAP